LNEVAEPAVSILGGQGGFCEKGLLEGYSLLSASASPLVTSSPVVTWLDEKELPGEEEARRTAVPASTIKNIDRPLEISLYFSLQRLRHQPLI
jgi:hypothetical protein